MDRGFRTAHLYQMFAALFHLFAGHRDIGGNYCNPYRNSHNRIFSQGDRNSRGTLLGPPTRRKAGGLLCLKTISACPCEVCRYGLQIALQFFQDLSDEYGHRTKCPACTSSSSGLDISAQLPFFSWHREKKAQVRGTFTGEGISPSRVISAGICFLSSSVITGVADRRARV